MEISQNHNPVWINTDDAKKLNIKQGDAIKVTISDTVSGLESGYFIAMAVPTESNHARCISKLSPRRNDGNLKMQ